MKVFKDSEGREWILALNIGAVKHLRDAGGVDLTALNEGSPPLITRLTTDIILVCDLLYVLCRKQADERGINDEQFGRGLGGEAICAAWEAFQQEIIDFFRGLGRTELAKVVEANRAVALTQMRAFETKIGQLAAEMETRIEKRAAEITLDNLTTSGTTSTSSPDPSPSIPTP